jgi:competence CoiA-like predicted nuclease
MVAVVGNMEKGIININYKAIIEVLMEVYFKIIARRSTIFVRNQIASQLDTPLMSKRRYIISFIRV